MQSKVSKKLKEIRLNLTVIFEIVLPFLFFEFLVYGKNIKGISLKATSKVMVKNLDILENLKDEYEKIFLNYKLNKCFL